MTWQVDSLFVSPHPANPAGCSLKMDIAVVDFMKTEENVTEGSGVEQLIVCIIRICQGATWLPWKTHIAPCTSPPNNIDIDRDFPVN